MKSREEKSQLGQFITPKTIADFMAKLLCFDGYNEIRLIDAGVGTGSLTDSVLENLQGFEGYKKITHYDIDKTLIPGLE